MVKTNNFINLGVFVIFMSLDVWLEDPKRSVLASQGGHYGDLYIDLLKARETDTVSDFRREFSAGYEQSPWQTQRLFVVENVPQGRETKAGIFNDRAFAYFEQETDLPDVLDAHVSSISTMLSYFPSKLPGLDEKIGVSDVVLGRTAATTLSERLSEISQSLREYDESVDYTTTAERLDEAFTQYVGEVVSVLRDNPDYLGAAAESTIRHDFSVSEFQNSDDINYHIECLASIHESLIDLDSHWDNTENILRRMRIPGSVCYDGKTHNSNISNLLKNKHKRLFYAIKDNLKDDPNFERNFLPILPLAVGNLADYVRSKVDDITEWLSLADEHRQYAVVNSKFKKASEITYGVELSDKDPLDVRFGNDAGCCLGIYGEKAKTGLKIPQLIADNNTYVFNILASPDDKAARRVGMVLGFRGQEDETGDDVLLINSFELSQMVVPQAHKLLVEDYLKEELADFAKEQGFKAIYVRANLPGGKHYKVSKHPASKEWDFYTDVLTDGLQKETVTKTVWSQFRRKAKLQLEKILCH